jgi:hypothetical protein
VAVVWVVVVVWEKFADVSEVLAASIIRAIQLIALMMEAASTSEMSVNFYQTTWRRNAEDSHLCTRRRENLKSQILFSNMDWTELAQCLVFWHGRFKLTEKVVCLLGCCAV